MDDESNFGEVCGKNLVIFGFLEDLFSKFLGWIDVEGVSR